ncbi:MAG TPA: DUF983 domain-containing protein [Gemmatimonadaceae bacterium]|nr:DUF983 domain-containing protein [Gemmatimonadaceae bacterium]
MTAAGPRAGLAAVAGRALTLRCPRCGARGILAGWFKLKDACPVCALALRRAPGADEWFGGYFINLIASELLMVFVVVAYVLATIPNVRWTTVEILGVVMVIVSPVVSYPFAKVLWVAVELEFAERQAMEEEHR